MKWKTITKRFYETYRKSLSYNINENASSYQSSIFLYQVLKLTTWAQLSDVKVLIRPKKKIIGVIEHFKKKEMKSIFYKKENYENTISNIVYNHLLFYPTPANLSYFWSFGSLAALCLGIQILSGIFLAMHYVPSIIYAFKSVEHIMRDVNYGWLIRYMHANGASAFFAVVYCHIFRVIYITLFF